MIDRITEQPFCQTSVMCRAVDNLELLLSQPDESVDLIYCDILYGTGRNFGDYQDLKPIRSEIESHYLPRLIEMKRVLKSTGSIYLQMDTRINHWLRILMDDTFGYDNFRNEIVWTYRSGGGSKKRYNEKKDHILFYTKSKSYTFNPVFQKRRLKHDYGFKEIRDTKGEDENGFYYLTHSSSVWDDIVINQMGQSNKDNKKKLYSTQKPIELLMRIINTSSNESDTVADYYLGSGTTAVVAKELNRNFIGCDINPKAIEITNARLDAVS